MNSIMVLAEGAAKAPQPPVSATLWIITVIGAVGLVLFDLLVVGRNHTQKAGSAAARKAGLTLLAYVLLFAVVVVLIWQFTNLGALGAKELVAGWFTEYSLSVDNLFVFLTIFIYFAVPREWRMYVLGIAIAGAVVLRFAAIIVGFQALERIAWAGFVFALFLGYTAIKVAFSGDDDLDVEKSKLYRLMKRKLNITNDFHGDKLRVTIHGKKYYTPLAVVVILAMGFDLLFALDSVPAVLGVTGSQYIAFLATTFALLGMRQIFYFLDAIEGKTVGLNQGLGFILGFVAVKMAIANHWAVDKTNQVAGAFGYKTDLHPYEVSIGVSMAIIFGTLGVVAVVSLIASSLKKRRVIPVAELVHNPNEIEFQVYLANGDTMHGEWTSGLLRSYAAEAVRVGGRYDTGEGINVYAFADQGVEVMETVRSGFILEADRPTGLGHTAGIVNAINHAANLARNTEGRLVAVIETDARDEDEMEIRRAIAETPDNMFVVFVYVSDEPGQADMLKRLDQYNVSDDVDRVQTVVATNDDGTPKGRIDEELEGELARWLAIPVAV